MLGNSIKHPNWTMEKGFKHLIISITYPLANFYKLLQKNHIIILALQNYINGIWFDNLVNINYMSIKFYHG